MSPALAGGFLTTAPPGKPVLTGLPAMFGAVGVWTANKAGRPSLIRVPPGLKQGSLGGGEAGRR